MSHFAVQQKLTQHCKPTISINKFLKMFLKVSLLCIISMCQQLMAIIKSPPIWSRPLPLTATPASNPVILSLLVS